MPSASIIEELEDAISRGTSGRRVETLRRVTDLFLRDAERYTESQIELFDDVILRLSSAMEKAVRRELAERLAPVMSAPKTIIRSLAQDDEIDVARPILMLSSQLDDTTLASIARTKSQEHMLAIAGRKTVGEKVTDVLVERGDSRVAMSVAANEGARFSAKGYDALVERSKDDDLLAECVGLRKDIPPYLFRVILSSAREQVRKRLVASTTAREKVQLPGAIAGVADRIAVGTADGARDYTAIHRAIVVQHGRGALGEDELRAYAEAGKFDETVCSLSVLCGVPLEMVERLFVGDRPDPILILARAAGLSWPTLRAILQTRPGAGGLAPATLEEARESYSKLTTHTALRVLRFWQVRESSAAGG
ncbi:MAG: DUF2336 domain-containing protein [Phreatobacter sp.]|jgi:uncharacterized protein (DUF2336 family)|uniref:DUF2336 domain-containing protein n=1 Tax=Phreatobacter sp. TaxID=1966341 RepID=UPI004035A084